MSPAPRRGLIVNAARDEQSIDPPEDDTVENVRRAAVEIVTGLQRTIDELRLDMRRENWRRLVAAQAAAVRDAEVWLPLKTGAHDAGVKYETARAWAARGLIKSDKDGGRVIVELGSLIARRLRLTGK
jgi:hypothetical protein